MTQTTTTEQKILGYLESGAIEAAVLSLAHYHGFDKSLYQKAYAETLRQGMVFHLCQLFRAKKSSMDFLPDRALLGELTAMVVGMYREDMSQPLKSRQLTPDVMQSIFEMLVYSGLVVEFLDLYKSVNAIIPLGQSMKPNTQTLYAAISYTQHHQMSPERERIRVMYGI